MAIPVAIKNRKSGQNPMAFRPRRFIRVALGTY
jgi:hypothetical protein